MRRKFDFAVAIIAIFAVCALVFAACGETEGFTPYKITFYVDGEVYDILDVASEITDPASVLPEAPSKKGDGATTYVFSHWAFEDGTALTEDNFPESDASLYAVFNEVGQRFTVMFKDKDGNYLAVDGKYSQVVEKGGAAVAPEAPVFEGYTFKGWDKEFSDVNEDLIVNAVYEANVHTLTFVSFGEVVTSVDLPYGENVSSHIPDVSVPQGFTLLGWKSTDGEEYYDMPDKSLTYEAQWKLDVADRVGLSASDRDIIYGEIATLNLTFDAYDGISYQIVWTVDDEEVSRGEETSYVLTSGAGIKRVYARIIASYKGLESSVNSETVTVTVAKAPLSVGAMSVTLVYGEDYTPEITYDGFVSGDDESVLGSPVRFTTGYSAGAGIGNYDVTLYGAEADNYDISYTAATVKVEKKALTVTANDASVTYGDAFSPVGYNVVGIADCDNVEELGAPVMFCEYPSVSKDAGSYDVYFTGGFDNDKSQNYEITYRKGTLTVDKKTVYVSVDEVEDITYLDPVPDFTWSLQGTVYGEGKEAAGEIVTVCDYEAGSPAGEYGVCATVVKEGKNYAVEVLTTEQNPVKFNVNRYALAFEGSALKDNRYSEENWGGEADKFVTGEPAGFTVGGLLRATTDETGTYRLDGDALTEYFVWEEPFEVRDADGNDCTANFALTYSFSLTLGATVDIEAGNHEFDYDGAPHGAEVTVDGDYTVEYLNGESYTSQYPVFTDAGKYTVNFRVLDGSGESVAESSFVITINKISNSLSFEGQTEYVYNGGSQTVTGVVAKYEDAAISYEGNTFTDVPEGGKLVFVATSAETTNYKATSAKFEVVVDKADYTAEQVPSATVNVYAEPGKTLEGAEAPEHFEWLAPAAVVPDIGEQAVDAVYCADSRNYNGYATTVTVVGVKTPIEIISDGVVSVAFGSDYAPQYSFEKNSMAFDPSVAGVTLTVSADRTSFDVGSTYVVTLSLDENHWYDAEDLTVRVKVPSVLYGGTYYTIEDALRLTQENESYIVVAYDTSFAAPQAAAGVYDDASYYTLSSGENLLVPYSEAHSTSAFDYATGAVVKNNAYVTLYVPTGITFTSHGYVLVSAARNVGSAQPTGNASGKYGVLELAEGAELVSEGTLESLGYIQGEGKVTVKSGNLYEPMICLGYKGGNITYSIYDTTFPINQYTLNNIIADTYIYSGASYFAKAAVGASGEEIVSDVKFMGPQSSEFMQLTDGYILKSYDAASGKVRFDVNGTMYLNDMAIKLETVLGSKEMSTSGKQVPLPGYFDFAVRSGHSVTVNAGVKLLPGSSFTVESGATLNVNADVFVYSATDGYVTMDKTSDKYKDMAPEKVKNGWQDGGNNMAYPNAGAANYFVTAVSFGFDGNTPATVRVEGTLNVNDGAKIAGAFELAEGGKINVSGNASTQNTIKEDFTDYEDNIKAFDRVISVRAHYFTAYSAAYCTVGGEMSALAAGRTYTATDGVLTVA